MVFRVPERVCVCFSQKHRAKTKNKKHKSPGGKLVVKGVSEAQIIGTLLLVDGVCPWHRSSRGEAGHSGCLRVKVEGGESRTHKAQCPGSLARVQPKIITAEGADLFQSVLVQVGK